MISTRRMPEGSETFTRTGSEPATAPPRSSPDASTVRSFGAAGSLTSISAPRMLLAMCAAPVELHGVPRCVQPMRTVRLRAPPWYPASAGSWPARR